MQHNGKRDDFFRKELVEELIRVVKMMKDEANLEKKIYYFSATYGITSRTFRYSFSREVLLADFVLQATHGLLQDRWQRIKNGDSTVELTNELFTKLEDGVTHLIKSIDRKESIQEALEEILVVGFSTTGPGNYLREKGDLKL